MGLAHRTAAAQRTRNRRNSLGGELDALGLGGIRDGSLQVAALFLHFALDLFLQALRLLLLAASQSAGFFLNLSADTLLPRLLSDPRSSRCSCQQGTAKLQSQRHGLRPS